MSKHGMSGKRNAAKSESDKLAVERVELRVPVGWKAKAKAAAAAEGLSLCAWLRKKCGL